MLRPTDGLDPTWGIAAFSPRTGVCYCWSSLSSGEVAADGTIRLRLELPSPAVSLTVAAGRDLARHRYLLRTELPPADVRPAETHIEVVASTIRIVVPDALRAGPVLLERVGDPEWQAPQGAAQGLVLEAGEATLLLGPGDYELVDPIDPAVRQRFTAPSAEPVTFAARPPRAPAGRL